MYAVDDDPWHQNVWMCTNNHLHSPITPEEVQLDLVGVLYHLDERAHDEF
jgi:hypothetical protein